MDSGRHWSKIGGSLDQTPKPVNLQRSANVGRSGRRSTLVCKALGEFVAKHSDAEIDFYPGDLTIAVLRLFNEIKATDEDAARWIAGADLDWMTERYAFDRSLQGEAHELIASVNV